MKQRGKKLKICFVCDDAYPSYGGRGATTERWSEQLAKRGHQVTVFASRKPGYAPIEKVGMVTVYRFSGVPAPKTNKKLYLGLPRQKGIRRIFQREKFDIIHLNTQYFMSYLCAKIAKEMRIPLVAGLHTQPENITKNISFLLRPFVNKPAYRFLIKVCNLAEVVIVPSKLAVRVSAEGGLSKPCRVISNGIDLKEFRPVDCFRFKKKYRLLNSKVILYLGRLMKEKNILSLVKIFPKILKVRKDAKLLMVGEGYWKEELEAEIRSRGLEKQIIFTGRVDDAQRLQAYASSDVFVLPSLVELQGIVVLEAMAFGKPIVVAKAETSAASELVREGKNGYTYNPLNEEELAEKILRIICNPSRQRAMGKESLRLVQSHSIEKSIDQIEKVYGDLLGRRRKKD